MSQPRLPRRSVRRVLIAAVLATSLIPLASCTIADSEGFSESDVRRAFGGSPSVTAGAGRQGSSPAASGATSAATRASDPATGSATVEEPSPDAIRRGDVPPYAEILTATIRGASRSVTFTMNVAGELPRTMPDANTTMSLGFRLKIGDVPYVLMAKPSTEGWALSASKSGKPAKIAGTLTAKGPSVTMVVPWSLFSGPHAFTWTGYLAWDQSATVRSYAVDIAPNSGEAPYPVG